MLVSIQTLFFLADQISPLQVFCSSLQVFTFLYSSLYFSSVLFSYLHCFKVLCSSLEYSIVLYSSLEYNIVIYNSLQIPTVNLHFPAVLPAVLSCQYLPAVVCLFSCQYSCLATIIPLTTCIVRPISSNLAEHFKTNFFPNTNCPEFRERRL